MKYVPYIFTLLFIIFTPLLNAQKKSNQLVEETTELATKTNQQITEGDDEVEDENSKNRLDQVITLNAFGTGETTGHIATIHVQNKGAVPLSIESQTFFIPSDGRHQSYVGSTPSGITVGAGQSAEIRVHGYCVDIYTPPVSAASPMPALNSWIPVIPQMSEPMNRASGGIIQEDTVFVLRFGTTPVPAFDSLQIPGLVNSLGFTQADLEKEAVFIVTWPGTETSLGGTIDLGVDPAVFASLLVEMVDRVRLATTGLQNSGDLQTPFFSDSQKEKETVIQQTLWRIMGTLTGEEYTEEGFMSNIYTQFKEKTGRAVGDLPKEEEEKMNAGVADFWTSFTAVGVEAKVIKEDNTID